MSTIIASSVLNLPKKLPALPVIEHPALRRPSTENTDLQIQGTSGQHGVYSAGKLSDKGPLPPLRSSRQHRRKLKEHSRVLTWPMGQEKVKTDSKPAWSLAQHKMSPEELEELIQEKLTMGFHGLRQAFKSNDPMGKGNVSREAFTTIMYHLCGFLSAPQISGLLKRLGLDAQSTISFDDFISYFRDVEVVKKEWVDPILRPTQEANNTANLPANKLRNRQREIAAVKKQAALQSRRRPVPKYYSAIQVFPLLKKKSRGGTVDLHAILPPSCFDVDGMVLKPQLRTALQLLGMEMYDEEFDKVWDRVDASGLGAVDSVTFFRCLGVNPFRERRKRRSGKLAGADVSKKEALLPEPENEVKSTLETNGESGEAEDKQEDNEPQDLIKLFSDKLTEGYTRLLGSFNKYDSGNTGKVSKEEFRKVLSEYRLELSSTELENLLSRCGLHNVDRVSYKKLLEVFLDRSEGGILKSVLEDPKHRFNRSRDSDIGDTTAADAEARLLDLFQADFLSLLAAFRQLDRDNLGVVKRYQFKEMLESHLNTKLTSDQLSSLLRNIGADQDKGLVSYPAFLELFTSSRNHSKSISNGNSSHGSRPATSPAQFPAQLNSSRPASMSKTLERCVTQVDVKKGDTSPRSSETLIARIGDLLTEKFHMINKTFMGMEQPKKGYLTKQIFQRLFERHGLRLTPTELDLLWAKFPTEKGDMLTFLSLVQHCFLAAGKLTSSDLENGTASLSQVLQDYAKAMFRKTLETHFEESEIEEPEIGLSSPRKAVEEPRESVKPSEVDRLLPSVKRFDKIEIEAALSRIKQEVCSHWTELRDELKDGDQESTGTVATSEFKAVVKRHCKSVSQEDFDCLVARFDRKKNERISYLEFLNVYLPTLPMKSPELPRYKSQTQIAWSEGRRTEEAVNAIVQKIKNQMIADWKGLRRSFKKVDISGDGFLSVAEFKGTLSTFHFPLDDEDFYHILSAFDVNLDGRISYVEFMKRSLAN